MTAPPRLTRVVVALVLLSLCGLSFAARVLPARDLVLPESGEVELLGSDAWFHLRHARSTLDHFPRVQRFDVGSGYPTGEPAWHAGLFHVGLAATAILMGGAEQLPAVAAWTPPWLGALSVFALFFFARASLGAVGALLAAALFVLHPGTALDRTLLGAADHHAAEILLAILSAGAFQHLLVRSERAGDRSGAPLPALLAALPLASFLFTWLGAPLHVVLAGSSLAVVLLVSVMVGEDPMPIGIAGLRYGTGLLLWLAGLALALPSAVMHPGVFPWLLLSCGVLALGAIGGAALARTLQERGWRRGFQVANLALVAAVPIALAFAGSSRLRFFAGEILVRKPLGVAEHRDLDLATLLHGFGAEVALAALAVPLAFLAVAGRRRAASHILPAVMTVGLGALAWRTRDYAYTLGPFLALLAAQTCDAAWSSTRRAGVRTALLVALLLLMAGPHLMGWVRKPFVPSEFVGPARVTHEGWRQALTFLRERTPRPTLEVGAQPARPPSGDFDFPDGTWGVMAAWDRGSVVAALGERPVVVSGAPRQRAAAFLLTQGDDDALASLCPDCRGAESVRWVVLSAETAANHFLAQAELAGLPRDAFQGSLGSLVIGDEQVPLLTFGPRYDRAMVTRLLLRDGDGLGRFRLVYESPHRSGLLQRGRLVEGRLRTRREARPLDTAGDVAEFERMIEAPAFRTPGGWAYDGRVISSVKVFEVVEGARLRGVSRQAGQVEARIRLRAASTGRSFVHRVAGRTDASGRFELRLPYATDSPAGDVEPLGSWHLVLPDGLDETGRVDETGGVEETRLRVTAEQVERGTSVEVGDGAESF